MQIKLLKIFCDVASLRSFSRAADENNITQSAASQMVNQIEHRLDVKLIDRSKRPFVLTLEGELFYRECKKLVERYYLLEEKVRTLHTEVCGRVRVASIYSVGLSHMNQFVQEFMAKHPKANVRVEYRHPDDVYQLIEQDEADVGLVSYPRSSRTVNVLPWRDEPMVIACAPEHELASLDVATPRHLHGQSLVAFQKGLKIRTEIDKALASFGAEVKIAMEFDNTETMKRAIEINSGIGLLPEPTVAREIRLGTLVAIPFDQEHLVRPLGIIQRRGKEESETTHKFVEFLLKSDTGSKPVDVSVLDTATSPA